MFEVGTLFLLKNNLLWCIHIVNRKYIESYYKNWFWQDKTQKKFDQICWKEIKIRYRWPLYLIIKKVAFMFCHSYFVNKKSKWLNDTLAICSIVHNRSIEFYWRKFSFFFRYILGNIVETYTRTSLCVLRHSVFHFPPNFSRLWCQSEEHSRKWSI